MRSIFVLLSLVAISFAATSCQYDYQCTSTSQGLAKCVSDKCTCTAPFTFSDSSKACSCASPAVLTWISQGATCLVSGSTCFSNDQCQWPKVCSGAGSFPTNPGTCVAGPTPTPKPTPKTTPKPTPMPTPKPTPSPKPTPMPTPVPAASRTIIMGHTYDLGDYDAMAHVYFPRVVSIRSGDTLVFQNQMDVHIVTFGPTNTIQNLLVPVPSSGLFQFFVPTVNTEFDGTSYVNSGIIPPMQTYNVTVTAPPGVYMYRCMIHPLMTGYVIVGDERDSQSQISAKATTEMNNLVEMASVVLLAASTSYMTPLNLIYPEGLPNVATPTMTVIAGAGDGISTYLAFLPINITVIAGTTVRYINKDPFEPHTVTFGTVPDADPNAIQESGGGLLTSSTQYLNSGWLFPLFDQGVNYYDITFQDPGLYKLVCVLHEEMGMVQWVQVVPSGI